MRLGSSVTGRLELASKEIIAIPASALTQSGPFPAVWIVDPASSTVSLRSVEILRFDPGCVNVSHGLEPKDIVVSGGIQALHPGQKVQQLPTEVRRSEWTKAAASAQVAADISACSSPLPP
jgi:multidrug efflux pump subunit AcrA (membrane-fusion protein)